MVDLTSAILLGALSLMPGNRYILLGFVFLSLIIYAGTRQRPSRKLSQVEEAIQVAEETLESAKVNCARKHVDLVDGMRRLLKAKISASDIQARLLDTHSITTWKKLIEYLQEMRGIAQSINQCAKEVKEIHISTLRTIEAERHRQFSKGIKEYNEILDGVVSSSAGRLHATRRRFASAVTDNTAQETSMV
ncbi:hypothetical protein MVEN_00959900 [Mycena venus]|uniref:Uncharacterized protein n=1 Tax=Mycena venus TaxID=2733690 RepID=A0A8H6YCM2_9AGAR|nr:hypothetical protein MVEN_00959900 [Mycena venus]